ncbi:MAG: acyloxyacyl hydrolase [Alphaproteobacteria bacterium]|nr:acyloxyacyl hydrolase [Alphaproteobacteria bacterium]
MRRIVLLISALAATPAFAQYSNYGYDAQYQQQYFQQQAQGGYQQPVQYQQPYQAPAPQVDYYQQAQYQQPYQQPLAQAQINPAVGLVNTDYLRGGIGMTQVVDDNNATAFSIEYNYLPIYMGLRPIVGFYVDTDSALYGYAGFNWDFYLTDSILFTPTASVGAYSHGDDGMNLGHWIEFRTGVELSYEMESKSRVGLQLTHLSNAGLGDKNPGTEILQVNYAYPLGWQR